MIDPSDYYIIKEKTVNTAVTKIYGPGNPRECVDLAFVAEGYRADEMNKFREDVKKMADILFAESPFSDYMDKINIWAVEAVSSDSGTDIPGEKIYNNTVLNSTFFTFGSFSLCGQRSGSLRSHHSVCRNFRCLSFSNANACMLLFRDKAHGSKLWDVSQRIWRWRCDLPTHNGFHCGLFANR